MENIKIKSRFYLYNSFLNDKSILGENIVLKDEIHKHLAVVLRAKLGDYITLYNEESGEYLAKIVNISKNNTVAFLLKKTRNYIKPPQDIILAYAPLKKDATDFLIEKATELGIHAFINVITQRTVNKPLSIEKIQAKVIIATNQCGRIDIPFVNKAIKLCNLGDYFKSKSSKYCILWLNEGRNSEKLTTYLRTNILREFARIIILIGPEGGFTNEEKDFLQNQENIINVYLNTNILRAETAGISALITYKVIVDCF